jgi:TRAP-type C4-dicarboxylate transport system permease small subunit
MIDRFIGRLVDGILVVLGWLVAVAVCLNLANVIGRHVLGNAIFGADEVQTYLMVWMAFLGAVAVTWRDAHLRMDVLVRYLPAMVRRALSVVELTLVLATALVVSVQSWRFVQQMATLGRRSDAAEIPMAIPHGAVLAGFALIALIAASRLLGGHGGAAHPVASTDSSGAGERP